LARTIEIWCRFCCWVHFVKLKFKVSVSFHLTNFINKGWFPYLHSRIIHNSHHELSTKGKLCSSWIQTRKKCVAQHTLPPFAEIRSQLLGVSAPDGCCFLWWLNLLLLLACRSSLYLSLPLHIFLFLSSPNILPQQDTNASNFNIVFYVLPPRTCEKACFNTISSRSGGSLCNLFILQAGSQHQWLRSCATFTSDPEIRFPVLEEHSPDMLWYRLPPAASVHFRNKLCWPSYSYPCDRSFQF
jgi:hypothetical protein